MPKTYQKKRKKSENYFGKSFEKIFEINRDSKSQLFESRKLQTNHKKNYSDLSQAGAVHSQQNHLEIQ